MKSKQNKGRHTSSNEKNLMVKQLTQETRNHGKCQNSNDKIGEDSKIIEDLLYKHFNEKGYKDHDSWDYLFNEGNEADALMYSELFWPDFLDTGGVAILRTSSHDTLQENIEENIMSKGEIEQAYNFVETMELFGRYSVDLSDEEYDVFVNRLVEMWSAKLKLQFPDRNYIVERIDNEEIDEYGIWFYQV